MGKTAILPVPKRRYDVTAKKKAELDLLEIEVLDAQHEVEQYQAMVDSLTDKSNKFQGFLAIAESKRDQARTNLKLTEEVVRDAIDLEQNSNIALDEISDAEAKAERTAKNVEKVVKELIYSAEVINKFSNMLVKKKEQNPLISDELMSIMASAGKDANNAIALTLVALKSSFASHASNIESQATASLEWKEAVRLSSVIRGSYKGLSKVNDKEPVSLESLMKEAYVRAKYEFSEAQKANKVTIAQLENANTLLNKAQVKLASLQAGLAAANAAAFAS